MVFWDLVFNIKHLKFSSCLRVSVVDCRRHILPRYRYRTNEASFSTSYWEIPVNIYILITVKHLPAFYRPNINTVYTCNFPFRLSISVYCRRHILPSCVVVWKDINRMKYVFFFIKSPYFVLSVFLLKIVKYGALRSPRGWNKSVFHSKNILFPIC